MYAYLLVKCKPAARYDNLFFLAELVLIHKVCTKAFFSALVIISDIIQSCSFYKCN